MKTVLNLNPGFYYLPMKNLTELLMQLSENIERSEIWTAEKVLNTWMIILKRTPVQCCKEVHGIAEVMGSDPIHYDLPQLIYSFVFFTTYEHITNYDHNVTSSQLAW